METNSRGYLDDALIEYSKSDYYPFHMPGHKRQKLGEWIPESIDITEIEGFDNLHHPEGIIKKGQRRLAKLCGADESFYLVNGSTSGILSAICGVTKKNDRILIGRNCHKAVYHAAYLMELRVEYLYPEQTDFGIQGSILPEQVEEKLKEFPDTAAVVITSPTYDGIVSDIGSIAEIVHVHGIPLIVDEAHGAHFGFSDEFPGKAISQGADLCMESLHKTLPSFTQTAALHAKKTKLMEYRFDIERVKRYLGIFQSSSPSYVFMAGMDRCVRMIQDDREKYQRQDLKKESLFGALEKRLKKFYRESKDLKRVEVFPFWEGKVETEAVGIWAKDNSKILITAEAAGLNGQQLYDVLLEKYHLQMEMASGHYVTAITSIMDTEAGFSRLLQALQEIDRDAVSKDKVVSSGLLQRQRNSVTPLELYSPREKKMEITQAMDAKKEEILLEKAADCISGEFIYLYPPGIPMIAPGEVITGQVLQLILTCQKWGMDIQGPEDTTGKKVKVIFTIEPEMYYT